MLREADLRRAIVGLCLAMLLSAIDQTIVVAALPTIGATLGNFADTPWIVTAYLIASAIVTPLYGKLADIHGARKMLLVGISVFVVGSAACALAPTMTALCAARAVQGAGGGGLISLAQIALADLVSPRERGRYQAYFGAVFAASSLAGPALGGFFAERLHWSLIFWINLPLGLVAFTAADHALGRLPTRRHPHQIDYLGAGLLALGSGLLAFALADQAAEAASRAGVLALSALSWALFAWRLGRAEEPFIPLSVLADPIVRDATLSGAFGFGALVGGSVVLPIYFQGALGLSAEATGVAMIPMMVGTVIGATLSGRLMAHLPNYKAPAMVGLAVALVATLLTALKLSELSLFVLDALLTLVSIGIGAVLPVSAVSVQNAVDTKSLGSATAAMQFARQIAGAMIAALLGALMMGDGQDLAPSARELGASFVLVNLARAACLALALYFLARLEEKPLGSAPAAREV